MRLWRSSERSSQVLPQAALKTDVSQVPQPIYEPVGLPHKTISHHCLALALFWEGGSIGEEKAGLSKMARAMLGRMWDNVDVWGGDDLCKVVFYRHKGGRCQFDFACKKYSLRHPPAGERWRLAERVADEEIHAFQKGLRDASRYFLNPKYSSTRNRCLFRKEFAFEETVGSHDFYRPPASPQERAALAKGTYPECKKLHAKAKGKKFAKAKHKKRFAKKRSRLARR